MFQVGPAGGRVRRARTRLQLVGEAAVAAAWVVESEGAGAEVEVCWGLEVAEASAEARGAEAVQGVVADRGTSRGGTPSAAITNRPYIISSSTRPSSYTPFIPIICRRHTANTVRRRRVIPPWISRWIFAPATCKYILTFIVCALVYTFFESFSPLRSPRTHPTSRGCFPFGIANDPPRVFSNFFSMFLWYFWSFRLDRRAGVTEIADVPGNFHATE